MTVLVLACRQVCCLPPVLFKPIVLVWFVDSPYGSHAHGMSIWDNVPIKKVDVFNGLAEKHMRKSGVERYCRLDGSGGPA